MRWLLSLLAALLPLTAFAASPNVLVVITDDQGFGDLGAHGNPVVKTPELDRFAKQSAMESAGATGMAAIATSSAA